MGTNIGNAFESEGEFGNGDEEERDQLQDVIVQIEDVRKRLEEIGHEGDVTGAIDIKMAS